MFTDAKQHLLETQELRHLMNKKENNSLQKGYHKESLAFA